MAEAMAVVEIVALRNEKGSYNTGGEAGTTGNIVALRNEKGSYNAYIRYQRPI